MEGQLNDDRPIFWNFTYAENEKTWDTFFSSIKDTPLCVVGDGQRGMFKAFRQRFPRVLFQRCQFHVIKYVNTKLTKNPESTPAIEFKKIVNSITTIRSASDQKQWLTVFKLWYQENKSYLEERTIHENSFTPKGRQRWSRTHDRLYSAYSHVKNAYPYLFTYLKNPNIPNTSNRVEGSINAELQRQIDAHRGKTLFGRRQIIGAVLKKKQRKKPTQNYS